MESNLLIITYDQLRADHVHGEIGKKTMPYLNSLCRNAFESRRCYTSAPTCVPARLSLLTGKEPSRFNITRNEEMNIDEKTPSMFNEIVPNHEKQLIGKTHWTSHYKPDDLRNNIKLIRSMGFSKVTEIAGPRALVRIECELTDEWKSRDLLELYRKDMNKRYRSSKQKPWKVKDTILPIDMYPDYWITEKSLNAIEKLPYGKPWLLWISFVGPHEPFDFPGNWNQMNFKIKQKYNQQRIEWGENINHETAMSYNKWQKKLTDEEIWEIKENYAHKCYFLDNQTKRIISHLKKRGDYPKTSVLITSDHGEMLGDYGMLYKGCMLEEAVRVPFIYKEAKGILGRMLDRINIKLLKKQLSNSKDEINTRPIELRTALRQVLKIQKEGGGVNYLTRSLLKRKNNKDYAVIELGEEIMIVREKNKIVLNKNGKILWGGQINYNKDGRIEDKVGEFNEKKEWQEIKKIASKELSKRKSKKWVIRDLKLNSGVRK